MIYYFLFNITVCYFPSSRNYILLLNLQRNQTRKCRFGKWEFFCLTSGFQHQVDNDRLQISLGMKNSYFRDDDGEDIQTTSRQSTNKTEKKRAMKKAKKEREREIMAAKERLLAKDIPKNTDDFEKALCGSSTWPSCALWLM
ncbi:uncharacterized protein LOC115996352 [Ipomoea triloba]|uniref:uncharacterized protein LOC115996352 n=1 Tax=Ipomoea triloba TaxID=35885 RepID=UPI00125D8C2B|nr:uncharacterized protein LOC115996352 [Ipomoea triloba]